MRKTKRRGASLALGTALAVALAACGGGGDGGGGGGGEEGAHQGGTLKVIGASDVDHLDPASGYYVPDQSLYRATVRQLFTYPSTPDMDKATKIKADLATKVPTTANGGISKDGKTYTIKMRHNAYWNTDPKRPVTAGDVVRGMKRLCNPVNPVGAPGYYRSTILGMKEYCDNYTTDQSASAIASYIKQNDIKGVKALDKFTVQFKLIQPATDFLNILALTFSSPAPKEYLKYKPDSPQMRQHYLSNGPYEISKYDPNHEIDLDRNPAWEQKSDPNRHQYVDKIVVTESQKNPDAALQQLKVGTSDLLWDLPVSPPQIPQMIKTHDKRLQIHPAADTNPYLVFNLLSPNNGGALKNLDVRKAIAYAIDKTAIIKIYGGPKLGTPLDQVIPKGNVGYEKFNLYPTPGHKGDTAKCKALLKKAGYKPGEIVLKDIARNAGVHPQVSQSVQQDLKRCGIKTKIVSVTQADYYGKYMNNVKGTKKGVWDISEPGWIPDWYGNNGRAIVQPLFDGRTYGPNSVNYGDYDNPKVNALIDKALSAKTEDEAAQYWHQADVQIMKDVPFVPFKMENFPAYHSSRVHHAVYMPQLQNFDWTQLWLSD